MTAVVQPAGPGGPASLRPLRNAELANGISAVKEACRDLIRGGVRPSITKVAEASGLSVSSINREPYKGMLRAARASFELVAQGRSYEEAIAAIGDTVEKEQTPEHPGTDTVTLALIARIRRLEAEVSRRDEQLYHTLGIVSQLRVTLRWHRKTLRDLNMQIEGLATSPLPARSPRVWQEDLENAAVGEVYDDFDDEDEDEEEEEAAIKSKGRRRRGG